MMVVVEMMATAVYIACREMGTPKTLNDIIAIDNIGRKHLTRYYRQPIIFNCLFVNNIFSSIIGLLL